MNIYKLYLVFKKKFNICLKDKENFNYFSFKILLIASFLCLLLKTKNKRVQNAMLQLINFSKYNLTKPKKKF